jgi:signal transduction histidine kinase
VTTYAGPRELRRLLTAVMAVAYEGDVATVLEHIVIAARDMVGARYAALGVLDPGRTFLAQFITVGIENDERARIGELPKGHGLLGVLITDPKPVRLPDLSEHPDSFGFPLHHPPMKSFLGVPLYVQGEVFGNLYLADKEDEDGFSDIDEELALSLAAAAALAIDNTRLHERAAELSVIEDRERIGRDLHDTVLQELFATALSMHGTARLAEAHPEIADRLQRHIDDIDNTIRDMRSAIFKIEVARVSGTTLRREVLDLLSESARVLGFEPAVQFDGPIDTVVSADLAGPLLAVMREALSNVARHAAATHVDVTVRVDANLLLEVVDDGTGATTESGGGNGLRNMSQRAQQLGGQVDIVGSPGGGTRLEWVVPLPA